MTENPSIADALPQAVEALLRRKLSGKEVKTLREYFDEAVGSPHDRTAAALKRFTGLSPAELQERAKNWGDTRNLSQLTLKWMVQER